MPTSLVVKQIGMVGTSLILGLLSDMVQQAVTAQLGGQVPMLC